MKKKRFRPRKPKKAASPILLGILSSLLVVSLASVATSTLAWFNISNYVRTRDISIGYSMKQMEMKLKDGDNLVSPNENGVFHLSEDYSFTAVSGINEDKWYSSSLDPETAEPSYYITTLLAKGQVVTEEATPNETYLSFDFEVTSPQDMYLFLDESTSIENDEEHNEAVAKGDADYLATLNRLPYVTRVGFFSNMGYTRFALEGNETNVYYGGPMDIDGDGYFDVDPSTNKEILYGEYDDSALSELEYSYVEEEQEPLHVSSQEAAHKKGTYAIVPSSLEKIQQEGLVSKESAYSLKELTLDAETRHPILFVPSGETRHLNVSIYLEGWDKRCELELYESRISMELVFKGLYASKGYADCPLPVLGSDAS